MTSARKGAVNVSRRSDAPVSRKLWCCAFGEMWGTNSDLGNEGEGSLNQMGGVFLNGRPLPSHKRRLMIELACEGMRPGQISKILKVSNGCVSKILARFHRTGAIAPKATGGSRPKLLTPELISIITQLKRQNPSLFAWEIRQKLQTQLGSRGEHVPSVSSINRILKKRNQEMDSVFPSVQHSNTDQMKEWRSSQIATQTSQLKTDRNMQKISHGNRTAFTPEQSQSLETEFRHGVYPDLRTREKLSEETHLPQDKIKVWFSNRRARMRRERQADSSDCGFRDANRPGFMKTYISQPEALYAEISYSLIQPRNNSFSWAHLNFNSVPTCSLDHGGEISTFYHGNQVSNWSSQNQMNGSSWVIPQSGLLITP